MADKHAEEPPITPLSAVSGRPPPTDYYNPNESPPVPTTATFSYDSPLADTSPDAAAAAAELAKKQAQARRDASRKQKFVECLSKDTVDIGKILRYLQGVLVRDLTNALLLLAELRKLTWAGIPRDLRPIAWQLLLVRWVRQPARFGY